MIKGCLRIVPGDTVLSGILLLKNTVAAAESSIISSAKIKNGAMISPPEKDPQRKLGLLT